jgi:uncharacterized protein YndB with AHSA1/START domain
MKTLEQEYEITAPAEKVYRALTDAAVMEQWGAGPARSDAREGGEWSLWDGDIHGTYTKLVPNELIEQDWYGHDNPTWKYTVRFSLKPVGEATIVHMTYAGDILDEQKDIADWREYYFEPIKKLLEQKD